MTREVMALSSPLLIMAKQGEGEKREGEVKGKEREEGERKRIGRRRGGGGGRYGG